MKARIFLGALMLLVPFATQAADLPRPGYKGPIVPIEPAFTWTGFYIGGNLGYEWGSAQWTGGAGNFKNAPNGFIGGGTFGYNYQTGDWVWGVEGDIDYVNAKNTANNAFCSSCTFKDTWLGTFRGRIGYSFGRWMPYFTAGGAWGNIYMASSGGSATNTNAGWTAGTGVEYALTDHWSTKLEYLYVDLGDAKCGSAACVLPADATIHFTSNILRLGVNYRF
jgi:outer membrane immunogenic protein